MDGQSAPSIDYLERPPSYSDFLNSYLLPNRPCLIGPALVRQWPAFRSWRGTDDCSRSGRPDEGTSKNTAGPHTCPYHTGDIDWDHLVATYGSHSVAVADCNVRYFSDQKREEMTLAEAVGRMKAEIERRREGVMREGAAPGQLAESECESLYIKDWHLVLQSKDAPLELDDRMPYRTPGIFADDWLNNNADTSDDFRFCYAGLAGTFTPLHRDVYTSYSWSTNIVGRKRWWLFPPHVAHLLRQDPKNRTSQLAYDVRDVSDETFPGVRDALQECRVIEQEAGETIFVPSNWHHQVENLTDCISLNHNWCNSVTLPSTYEALKNEAADVSEAISDVRDMLKENAEKGSTAVARSNETSAETQDGTTSQPEESMTLVQGDDWEVEWLKLVDDLMVKDAGWGWKHFLEMVEYNICPDTLATSNELRPPISFVHERVKAVLDDFVTRKEYEKLDDLRQIVDRLRSRVQC